MSYTLAIGDYRYSSWSYRAWVLFDEFGIDRRIAGVDFGDDRSVAEMLADLGGFGSARTVPALRIEDGGGAVALWDTLAIAETLAERHPDLRLWPRDSRQRALARAIVAEMHSGFGALRSACPMNLDHAWEGFVASDAVVADVARIERLWSLARAARTEDGPWLFGAYSIADAFYGPVAARIAGYRLTVGPEAADYVATHLAHGSFRRFRAMGLAEGREHDWYVLDLPRAPWPGPQSTPGEAVTSGEAINETCPYSGKPHGNAARGRIEGRVIGFCNVFCRDKAIADPGAWPEVQALLAASNGSAG
ncbi:MAG: glutathione S-transferase [Rubricella sp.]